MWEISVSIQSDISRSDDDSWSGAIYRLAISSLICLSFFYTLAFDYMPDQVRLQIAGAVAAGYIALSFERILFTRDPAIRWMFAGLFLIALAWAAGSLANPFDPERASTSVTIGFRNISGLFSGIVILGFADRINPKLILFGFIALIGMAAVVAFAEPAISLAGSTRLHPFTGGAGLHASAYVVALAVLGVFLMWKAGYLSTRTAVPVLLLGVYVILGYAVRTALVLLIIAAVVIAFQAISRRTRYLAPTLISFGFAGIFLVFLLLVSFMDAGTWKDLVNFSSGRLATYSERIGALAQRDLLGQIFGSGPGSDIGFSRQWFWGAKDSHNDFLRHFKEDGMTGTAGLVIYLIGIFRFARFDGLPVVLCLIGSSAISNALLARPTIIVFLFLTLVIVYKSRVTATARL